MVSMFERLNITIPKDLLKKLRIQAEKERRNISNMVTVTIEYYLENKK